MMNEQELKEFYLAMRFLYNEAQYKLWQIENDKPILMYGDLKKACERAEPLIKKHSDLFKLEEPK